MSVEITFNKSFTLNDVLEKTSLKVEEYKDGDYLILDNYGNSVLAILVNKELGLNSFIDEISLGGYNIKKIFDEIVYNFQTTFITDNEIHDYFMHKRYHPEIIYDLDSKYDEITTGNGYIIDPITKFISLPHREESDYFSPPVEPQKISDEKDDDLPF